MIDLLVTILCGLTAHAAPDCSVKVVPRAWQECTEADECTTVMVDCCASEGLRWDYRKVFQKWILPCSGNCDASCPLKEKAACINGRCTVTPQGELSHAS